MLSSRRHIKSTEKLQSFFYKEIKSWIFKYWKRCAKYEHHKPGAPNVSRSISSQHVWTIFFYHLIPILRMHKCFNFHFGLNIYPINITNHNISLKSLIMSMLILGKTWVLIPGKQLFVRDGFPYLQSWIPLIITQLITSRHVFCADKIRHDLKILWFS